MRGEAVYKEMFLQKFWTRVLIIQVINNNNNRLEEIIAEEIFWHKLIEKR